MRSLIRLLAFCIPVSLMLTSCQSNTGFYCVEGADSFVMDSYAIREGKISILEMQGKELQEPEADAWDEYVDYVYDDDILSIIVYHPTRVDLMNSIATINSTIGFRVVDGKVDIPDLEAIEVAGLTLDEAREALQSKYREQVADIEVFVTYKDRLTRRVDMVGLTGTPYLPVDGKMRLYDVMSKARVPNTANLFMSYVLRDGKPLAVDLQRLVHRGDMSQNIVMKAGDKIFIANPEASRAMIMGEVYRPAAVPLPHGYMSLREALVMAGGIPFTGDRQHIHVIRGDLQQPKIYELSWNHIVHLPNDSLLLMPGDTVYISEKPITQWNRFISQLLPSITGFQSGYAAYSLVKP